jgi:uncharacterized protein
MIHQILNAGRVAVVGAMCALAMPALAQKAPEASAIAAANELLEVTGSAKQMDTMIDNMVQAFAKGIADNGGGTKGEAMAAEMKARMAKFAAYKGEMLADMAAIYAANFSVAELKAIADFYRSGPGAKFIAAQPKLTPQLMQVGMKYAQKINEAAKAP